jgi:Flp pilus assembly protein TadD
LLDEALIMALGELSHQGELKPLAMELSKAATKVRFSGLETDAKLTFSALQGESKASFAFADLNRADHTLLARLVAEHRPSEPEAQALAGFYLELTGDTPTADRYYEKAGEDFKETIDALFE